MWVYARTCVLVCVCGLVGVELCGLWVWCYVVCGCGVMWFVGVVFCARLWEFRCGFGCVEACSCVCVRARVRVCLPERLYVSVSE